MLLCSFPLPWPTPMKPLLPLLAPRERHVITPIKQPCGITPPCPTHHCWPSAAPPPPLRARFVSNSLPAIHVGDTNHQVSCPLPLDPIRPHSALTTPSAVSPQGLFTTPNQLRLTHHGPDSYARLSMLPKGDPAWFVVCHVAHRSLLKSHPRPPG